MPPLFLVKQPCTKQEIITIKNLLNLIFKTLNLLE